MSIDYGLKYDIKKPKGQSIFYYLKNLRWNLKYAWQRAWRGWGDCEIHSFNYVFCIKMAGMMQQFKEDNIALFTDFEADKLLTEKETNDILDEMIYHFAESDGTKWIKAKGKAKWVNDIGGSKTVHQFNNIIGKKTHPCEKPVELLKFYIKNSSNEGDIVFDPFVGTGSTMIAAKELGRQFLGYELDTTYCGIANTRIQDTVKKCT